MYVCFSKKNKQLDGGFMKEIEILVEVFDTKDRVKEILNSFNYIGLNKVVDEYYYDPKRDTLKPSKDDELYHCLRLRTKNISIISLIKMIFMIMTSGYIQMDMRQK